MRPFLKWPGNKYRIIDKIRDVLPKADRLIEPFAGSGAVFLNTDYPKFLLGEVNPDLVNLYDYVKTEGNDFIEYCSQFFGKKPNNEKKYYQFRDEFNQTEDTRLKSALFIYFNKHGFNGLCRYNSKGQFNVPYGFREQVLFPEKQMHHFHQRSQQAKIQCADYKKLLKQATPNDVVYCDPPYVPLSETASFTRYSQQDFIESDQRELATLAESLMAKGITVVISNHDTPFTRELYQQAKIISHKVSRFISCDSARRRPVSEVIAIFSPNSK